MSVLSLYWIVGLVAVPAAYWLTPERFRSPLLAAVTFACLMLIEPISALLLLGASCLAWIGYRYLSRSGWAIAAIAATQTAPLVVYKFADQWPVLPGGEWIVPLGLSYFALRAIHYSLEAYKGALPPHGPLDVVSYMFFLPTIAAGPIHRFPQFLQDQQRRRWNSLLFSEGLQRILYGYVKVTFLANLVVNEMLLGFVERDLPAGSQAALYFTMIGRGLNGYLQFAGYSDIAIGFSRLLGFRVMENFNAPLLRRNVQEFWSAWHMSLTSWCRDYVYTPAFSLTRNRWLGILAAMAILGLWHEFTARYLIWGLYNGLGIVAWHQWRRLGGVRLEAAIAGNRILAASWSVLSVALTLHFIFAGFVLVQNDTLAGGIGFLRAMLGVN